MAPASSPGRPRIALVDAYNQALERLGKVLNKQEIEHRLVTAFAHRDIDVIGWYRIEDGESFFGTDLQAQFWARVGRSRVDWDANECRFSVIYDEKDWVTDCFAYALEVRRDQLELWMAAEEFAEGVEPQRRRAQSATNAQTAKEREALLRNRIQSVIAAARKMKNLSHRDIAKILVGTPSGQRFSSETIRKILAGTYPPQKDLGIGGL